MTTWYAVGVAALGLVVAVSHAQKTPGFHPVYCDTAAHACHCPDVPLKCTRDNDCRNPWYPDSYCQAHGSCKVSPPPECRTDEDCARNETAVAAVARYAPPAVNRICVTNSAGFVLHFDMRDLDTDEISPDSGTYPIDQTKCQVLSDIAHISEDDLIMCRVHAVAGETKDCEDAVKYNANSSETATFVCQGTTLDYSCKLE